MHLQKMQEKLQEKLSPTRYTHSLGVAYTAASMAMAYHVDMEAAFTAGLLHDCAKFLSDAEKIKKCIKHHIDISDFERHNPELLHAKLSAYYAKKKYGVNDPSILSAITYHTTGKPNMTDLEKIIYIADYIEPNRSYLPEIEMIRKEAFQNLDTCLTHILKNTIDYLTKEGYTFDKISMDVYEYYVGKKT